MRFTTYAAVLAAVAPLTSSITTTVEQSLGGLDTINQGSQVKKDFSQRVGNNHEPGYHGNHDWQQDNNLEDDKKTDNDGWDTENLIDDEDESDNNSHVAETHHHTESRGEIQLGNSKEKKEHCIDSDSARKLAETFEYFFVNLDEKVAQYSLHKDFSYWSDSDNSLVFNSTSKNPGLPTFKSHSDFCSGLPRQPYWPKPNPYVIEDVFHSCNKVAARWAVPGGFGGPPDHKATIRGISTFETEYCGDHWQIKKAYTEYNTLLAAVDVGRCDICENIK